MRTSGTATRVALALSGLLMLAPAGCAARAQPPQTPTATIAAPVLSPAALPPAAATAAAPAATIPAPVMPVDPAPMPSARPPGRPGTPTTAPAPAAGPQRPTVAGTPAQRATSDLAQRLGVSAASVRVVAAVTEEFPGADLGCPGSDKGRPETGVQPAFVMGQAIYLEVAGKQYTYHSHAGQIAFCGQR